MVEVATEQEACERAVSLITAFCLAIHGDEDAAQVMFDQLDTLVDGFLRAKTKEEVEAAKAAFLSVMMKILAALDGALAHNKYDLDKFELIPIVAQALQKDIE